MSVTNLAPKPTESGGDVPAGEEKAKKKGGKKKKS